MATKTKTKKKTRKRPNLRRERFAKYYAKKGNATEAAKLAGYSEKTAKSQGHRLLTNADVVQEVEHWSEMLEREVKPSIQTLADLRDDGSDGIRLKASVELLRLSEVGKQAQGPSTVNIYADLPTEKLLDKLADIQAKKLAETSEKMD